MIRITFAFAVSVIAPTIIVASGSRLRGDDFSRTNVANPWRSAFHHLGARSQIDEAIQPVAGRDDGLPDRRRRYCQRHAG